MKQTTIIIIIGIVLVIALIAIPEIAVSRDKLWTGPGSHAKNMQQYIDQGVMQTKIITWSTKTDQQIILPGNKGINSIQLFAKPNGPQSDADVSSYVNMELCNYHNCYYKAGTLSVDMVPDAQDDYDKCINNNEYEDYHPEFFNQFNWAPTCNEMVYWARETFTAQDNQNWTKLPTSEEYTLSLNLWRYDPGREGRAYVDYQPKFVVVWYWTDNLRKAKIPTQTVMYRDDGRIETDGTWLSKYTKEELCVRSEKDLYNIDCEGIECSQDEHCLLTQYCINNQCRCDHDLDCESQVCQEHICVTPECITDSDCVEGFECENNQCKEKMICPSVCIEMWEITNNECVFNNCGSGCGPDDQNSFSTEQECKRITGEQINTTNVYQTKTISIPLTATEDILPGRTYKRNIDLDVEGLEPGEKATFSFDITVEATNFDEGVVQQQYKFVFEKET